MVKLWEEVAHRNSIAMAHLLHFPFLILGMIWDHHIVRNNYGNRSGAHRYSIPAVKAHLLYLLYGLVWDHSVTQENFGSEQPIVKPYQQLIHTLLYLMLYGNDTGSFSYTGKLWE